MGTDRQSSGIRLRVLLTGAVATLGRAGVENSRLDAELLLAAAAGVDRGKLLIGSCELNGQSVERFRGFVARRASREPLAYIVGHREFFSLDFEVNAHVLIPRPETELVVEAALEFLSRRPSAVVLDLATGSGAIAVAIAVNHPEARVVATDISADAVAVARRNAERMGCAERIEFAVGDCWRALPCSHRSVDLIVSNPPYVPEHEMAQLEPEVARFEPAGALLGGKDGLEFYRRITGGINSYLAPDGEIIVEVGAGQAPAVAGILREGGCRVIEVRRDLAGHERVLRASRLV